MSNFINLNLLFFVGIEILLIFIFAKIAIKIQLIDIPNERKVHKGNIPLVGGVIIFSTFFFYFIMFETMLAHKIIFFASLIIFCIGLYDDIFNMKVVDRFFFQILATLLVIGFGIKIYDLGYVSLFNTDFFPLHLGGFGVILTFLSILGFTNAINFSDGIDGLAAGYLINCLMCILLFSFYNENFENLRLVIFLIISLFVFKIANHGIFLPKIFLGDNGSASLGFLVACLLIFYTLPDNRYFHPLLTIWAAPLPVLEFLTIISFRLFAGKSPFQADRQHLHYLLLKSIENQKIVTFLLISSSAILSFMGFFVFVLFGVASSVAFFVFYCIIYLLIYIYFKNQ